MKLILIFAFLTMPMICMAQGEPFKGANTLVVTSSDGYNQVMRKLIQDGFEIRDSNPEYGTINTGWKAYQNSIYYRMSIVVEQEKITFRSHFKNDAVNAVFNSQGSETPISWAKSGGYKHLWNLMDSFASNFGTEKEYFLK